VTRTRKKRDDDDETADAMNHLPRVITNIPCALTAEAARAPVCFAKEPVQSDSKFLSPKRGLSAAPGLERSPGPCASPGCYALCLSGRNALPSISSAAHTWVRGWVRLGAVPKLH
jgi:hypothetical protein